LLIGRYLFFQYGNAVVFFGRFIAVLRMFAALLAGVNILPAGRVFFFNITGGVCWACLFGFGTYAVGAEIYKISGTLSVISLSLFIAGGYALTIFIRRGEVTLRRRAEALCQIIRADDQLPLMARTGADREMSVDWGSPEVTHRLRVNRRF
jgi:membrane protein DedA with SNARE-associated domain